MCVGSGWDEKPRSEFTLWQESQSGRAQRAHRAEGQEWPESIPTTSDTGIGRTPLSAAFLVKTRNLRYKAKGFHWEENLFR